MAYDALADVKTVQQEVSAPSQPNTGVAQLLAYLAAAPLIVAALIVVGERGEAASFALYFMGVYGAALIVFFGGVRWGIAVMKEGGPTMRALLGAALPLGVAIPLFMPIGAVIWKLPVIMGVVATLLIDDLKATRRGSGAPQWYLAVRLPLTVLVELAFVIALVGAMR